MCSSATQQSILNKETLSQYVNFSKKILNLRTLKSPHLKK